MSEADQALIDAATSDEEKSALRTEAQQRQWRNKAISDTYEPGSVFKILTLSMALEEEFGVEELSEEELSSITTVGDVVRQLQNHLD